MTWEERIDAFLVDYKILIEKHNLHIEAGFEGDQAIYDCKGSRQYRTVNEDLAYLKKVSL